MNASEAWERFWFAPQATSTLALVRIATGLVALGWTLSLLPDLFDFFSAGGVLAEQPADQGKWVWGLLEVFPSDAALVVVYVALLSGSVALTLGLFSRLAALVTLVGLISFARRNFFVLNSGDGLIRVLVLFLVFAPSGEALSLDRLRRARDAFWEFPARAPWALRLIQIQLSVLYVSTVWQKVRGVTWNDGTAVSYLRGLRGFCGPSDGHPGHLLDRLVGQGVVRREPAGRALMHTLNREHLAAPAVEALATMRSDLLSRLRAALSSWSPPAVHASLFGSAARGDGDADSDIDIFAVRPDSIDPDDPRWREQCERLAGDVLAWTGNPAALVESSEGELSEMARSGTPILDALRRDGICLGGAPLELASAARITSKRPAS